MVTYVETGHQITDTAEASAGKPKWLKWTSAGNLGGTVETPAGFRRSVLLKSGTRTETMYFENTAALQDTGSDWQVGIFAPNRAYIAADGLTGFPTEGTPKVRLTENAPSKAVVRIPVRRGAANILDQDFAGWQRYQAGEPDYQGPVERGMELVVRYRVKGNLQYVFRGQIYQVERGEQAVELTAYDRMMDLYQFSDQYQSHQGRNDEWLNKAGDDGTNYLYNATQQVGAVTACREVSQYRIDAVGEASAIGVHATDGFVLHNLPDNGTTPIQGSSISRVATSIGIYKITTTGLASITVRVRCILYRRSGGGFAEQASTGWQELSWSGSTSRTEYKNVEWAVGWNIAGPPGEYFLGMQVTVDKSGAWYGYGWHGSTSRRTTSTYYISGDGSSWSQVSSGDYLPEIACDFTRESVVTASSVIYSGTSVAVPHSAVPHPSAAYLTILNSAMRIYLDYFILAGTTLQSIVRELIVAAGMEPDLDPGIDLGTTTYYTSSTFDYLTCIQEIVRGGRYGLRMPVTEPGMVKVLPRHTVDDTPVAEFTTDMDPSVVGERVILSHSLTQHWMAEKATVAMMAENSTESGLPLAFETDDELMDGSLVKALQSPLRGVGADATLGTHQLMANAAGGRIVQLHTNVMEGQIVVAGYRTDVWVMASSQAGDYAGGNPVRIAVPEAGVDAVAIPTEIELGDGTTKITLDNIRRADRSEVARSMGLTADAISNNTQSLPSTCFVFAKVGTYATQETGITPGTVTQVQWLKDGGTAAATQSDANYIRTAEDAAGYYHVCAVMGASPVGYAPDTPITHVAFTMGGTVYKAVLDNPKYSLGGQALHADIRFRKA